MSTFSICLTFGELVNMIDGHAENALKENFQLQEAVTPPDHLILDPILAEQQRNLEQIRRWAQIIRTASYLEYLAKEVNLPCSEERIAS